MNAIQGGFGKVAEGHVAALSTAALTNQLNCRS